MDNHRHLPGVLTVCVIAVMIAASELLGEREIIFPEIAAIAVGMLLAPHRPWQTSRMRVLVLISLSAVVGLAVSVLLPLPLWEKMCVAFLLAQVLLVFGGTSFAPLISAAVLPVMLGTESMVYLIAAVSLTALILLVNYALERFGLRAPEADESEAAYGAYLSALRFGVPHVPAPVFVLAAENIDFRRIFA